MSDDNLLPFSFPAVQRKKITAAFDGGRITSDGGVMLLAQAERRLGIAARAHRPGEPHPGARASKYEACWVSASDSARMPPRARRVARAPVPALGSDARTWSRTARRV